MCEAIRREWEAQAERKRFFHQPEADADFEYWAKMPFWTLEEAIALSFGKNPKIVTQKRMSSQNYRELGYGKSCFVNEYRRRWELISRAEIYKDLYDSEEPSSFILWAKKNDINIPQKLVEQVELRDENLVDWKQRYDDLLDKNTEYVKSAETRLDEQKKEIEKLRALLVLRDEQEKNENKPVYSKERDTFLKIIIAMAVEGYSYNPKAGKSPTPQEICDDLVKLGIPLDPDTVRAKLKESAGLLPQETEIGTKKPKSGYSRIESF